MGQAGDQAGEAQGALPESLAVPPAPALSAEEERATLRLPPGFALELVAAEPLVHDPVAAAFDGEGRLYVCEMRGFMPDVDGHGEDAPVGSVALLADRDGDGRMDERRVFLDGLVLPRALLPVRGGLLVLAPPELLLCRDTDGDGDADERRVLERGLGGLESPEHAPNALVRGADGWIHLANHPFRYRLDEASMLAREPVAPGGQWGLSRDDEGRFFFNTNSDVLRGDPFSAHYAVRNPDLERPLGFNLAYADDQRTWPARVTPGVNRGYRPGVLRADFTLATVTAACAPWIHRGDGLPAGCRGDAFVCEPAGNLVKRLRLEQLPDGAFRAQNRVEGAEFLTSTDERFRPVNLLDGPDGALYVVDMYRGVIQHRLFVTSFLRAQIEERGLAAPIGRGRIWRVKAEHGSGAPGPDLAQASWTELGAALAHPNGFWRDRAQRAFAEEAGSDKDALDALRAAAHAEAPLARLHALWALSELGRLDAAALRAALLDKDPRVALAAVRCSEPLLGAGPQELVDAVKALGLGGPPRLARQVLFSLGEGRRAATDVALLEVLAPRTGDPLMRSAALSGLGGRELDLLLRLSELPLWLEEQEGRGPLMRDLALCVAREGRADRFERLLHLAATRPPPAEWQAEALLEGVLAARPLGPDGRPAYIDLASEPLAYPLLLEQGGARAGPAAHALAQALAWPGKPGVERPQVRPLTETERARFERGRELYSAVCAQCHQPSGLGQEGKAPALRGAALVLGDAGRLTRVVRYGLAGPLADGEARPELEMPAWTAGAEDLACVLTYLRREWGHGAEPVEPALAAAVLTAVGARSLPYTLAELEEESAPAPGGAR
jgi:mono/diheme cytochrome c family protein/glucose/arabinose dehydrogenase